ncbi:MAG: hypothetical protein ACLFVX_07265 [Archaeoglobaceae archaeon]
MDKRVHFEIEGDLQDRDFKSLAHSSHEFNDLPPCFSCPAHDCEAVNCVKLEVWFNRTRQTH